MNHKAVLNVHARMKPQSQRVVQTRGKAAHSVTLFVPTMQLITPLHSTDVQHCLI